MPNAVPQYSRQLFFTILQEKKRFVENKGRSGRERTVKYTAEVCISDKRSVGELELIFLFIFPLWIRYYRPASVREIAMITENNTKSVFSCSRYYFCSIACSFSLRSAVAITEKISIKIGMTE